MALPWHLPNICACVWTLTCLDVQDLTWRGQNKLLCVCCTLWTGRSVCLSFHTCVSVCIHALWCVCVYVYVCMYTCMSWQQHTHHSQAGLSLGLASMAQGLTWRGQGAGWGGQGSKLACLHVCLPAMHVHAHATTRHLAWLACLYVCPIALACMCAHARHDLHAHAHDKHNHTNTAEQNSSESLVFVQRPCRTRALPLSLPRMRWKGKCAVESEKHVGKGKWERGREVREWS